MKKGERFAETRFESRQRNTVGLSTRSTFYSMDLTDFKAFESMFGMVIAAIREAWSVRERTFKSP